MYSQHKAMSGFERNCQQSPLLTRTSHRLAFLTFPRIRTNTSGATRCVRTAGDSPGGRLVHTGILPNSRVVAGSCSLSSCSGVCGSVCLGEGTPFSNLLKDRFPFLSWLLSYLALPSQVSALPEEQEKMTKFQVSGIFVPVT